MSGDESLTKYVFDIYYEEHNLSKPTKHKINYNDASISKAEIVKKLTENKNSATSYAEWVDACTQLDNINDKTQSWKQEDESILYDYKALTKVFEDMKYARLNKHYEYLLYLIRTTWERNLFNSGNLNLYRHSHIGTKKLIEDYLHECEISIKELIHNSDIDKTYLLNILMQTRKKIGRTALVLSGGATFGLFHIGVLVSLFEQDLLPKVISGSSAGAIVASILSIHTKEEFDKLFVQVFSTKFNIFGDESEDASINMQDANKDQKIYKQHAKDENSKDRKKNGEDLDDGDKIKQSSLFTKLQNFMKSGAWFDNKYLIETMISFLGDITFREAYNKTGKILNITVSPASIYEQPRLLNCNNSPNILIWSAVCSSCSLPGVFQSTPLYEKDPITGETRIWNAKNSTKFMDGSVDNDLPISRLSEMFNVDHIIACQVNIHIFPLLKLSVSCVGGEIEDEWSAKFKYRLNKISKYVLDEAIHLLDLTIELGITPNLLTKFKSVFLQQYSGDITILPDMDILKLLPEMLSNPTKKFLVTQVVNGLHSTWPKISIIKNHCIQEFALDSAILYLKSELITNNEAFLKSLEHPLHNTLNEVLLEKQGYTENNDEILVQTKKFIPRRRDNSLPSNSFRNSPSKPMSLTHRKMSLSK
ncbi:hypothetical protein ACO0RG_000089 [Hanseniaspora osmophila]